MGWGRFYSLGRRVRVLRSCNTSVVPGLLKGCRRASALGIFLIGADSARPSPVGGSGELEGVTLAGDDWSAW